jgi:S-formylglutathione hydrolase FrmB
VDNNTSLWVTDPANPPIYAPDGLTGNARRAFNKVNVPYDAEKQNFAPMAAREIENPRPDSAKGTWSYVPIQIGTTTRTLGVYEPPGYDPSRAEPYKTIYMQHGGGQDQSDWMNIGSVPVIMDNLLQDGLTEPAIVVTTNSQYLGSAAAGYPNLRDIILPFIETHYNVSTHPMDRAFAGLSLGGFITSNIINFDPTQFGYYGPWSGGVSVNNNTPNLGVPYILWGGGQWDFGLPNPAQVAARTNAFGKNLVVAGAHDFNAWNQLFTMFARDYLWKPAVFVIDKIEMVKNDIEGTNLNSGNKKALTVKLDQAYNLLEKGNNAEVVDVMNDLVFQVDELKSEGKLTDEEAARLVDTAEKIIFNVGYWL